MTSKLANAKELLFRQVRQHQMNEGESSSQAFRPLPKDHHRLSLDRSSLTNPQQSFDKFRSRGFDTVAVFGLSVGEFESLNISCFSDPHACNIAHSYADYSMHNSSQQRKRSLRLKGLAMNRGQLHPM